MKELLKLAALWTAVVVFIVLLFSLVATGGRLGSLWSNTYFAPKEEALRREVVEQSKAYRDGVVQDLRLLQVDYIKAYWVICLDPVSGKPAPVQVAGYPIVSPFKLP